MINEQRLAKMMDNISKFGALQGGGISRLAYSKEEKLARNFIKNIAQNANLHIKEDAAGNMTIRLNGSLNLPAVAMGSHVDSVPYGGKFDGTLGVICALEALLSFQERNIKPKRPIELIVFSCEESSRFNMATIGSKLMSGKLEFKKTKEIKDKDQISLYDAMCKFGCDIKKSDDIALPKEHFYTYVELHIEQGPVLEANAVSIGVVTGIAAPIRYQLTIKGRADHSGATPMNLRFDALAGSSEIILGIENIAKSAKTTVATVGYINVLPGVLNVIPGEVVMGIDIRDVEIDGLNLANDLILNLIKQTAQKRGLTYELKLLGKDTPTKLDKEICTEIEEAATRLNIKTMRLPSGAGHDAMHMGEISKFVGMIFIPCKDGISHNVKEEINFNDAKDGANVLAKVVLELSNKG